MTHTAGDPVMARKLERAGTRAVMPEGLPIGSGQGVLSPGNTRIILEKVKCPELIGAGCFSCMAGCMPEKF